MKLVLKLTFFLFALVSLSQESHSLTKYQIKKICKKERRESNCKRNLTQKRSNLEKGNLIEIPVTPYKGKLKIEFKFQILIRKD